MWHGFIVPPTNRIGITVLGLPLAVLAATPPLPVAAAVLAVSGFGSGPLNPLVYTIVQERAPNQILGRAFAVLIAGAMAATPIGRLTAGYVLEAVGLRYTIGAVAACFVAVILYSAFNPVFREMEKPAAEEPEEVS